VLSISLNSRRIRSIPDQLGSCRLLAIGFGHVIGWTGAGIKRKNNVTHAKLLRRPKAVRP
jgi:hypothetical protein